MHGPAYTNGHVEPASSDRMLAECMLVARNTQPGCTVVIGRLHSLARLLCLIITTHAAVLQWVHGCRTNNRVLIWST
jgi:hypothetical protein